MGDATPARTHGLDPGLQQVLQQIPVAIAVLDENRQVVFGQDRLLALVDAPEPRRANLAGPGDVMGCVNSLASKGGCGTTEACALCGANCAIVQSRERNAAVSHECRIRYQTDEGTNDLDLTVTATPYLSGGRTFTMLTVQDASGEKRRRALERVFFHDIMNLAGGLAGLAGILRSARDPDEIQEMLDAMDNSARTLLDEIEAQRQLASAETGDLQANASETNSVDLLESVVNALRYHSVAERRSIVLDERSSAFGWRVDPILLRRVLVNLTKNALEATRPGGRVTLRAELDGNSARFHVHNHGVMPDEVQRQLFQRSFSTKGDGRGLGTYSVRLLTERYLGGTVRFTSDEEIGTLFSVSIPTTPE